MNLQREGTHDRHCMIFSACVLVGVLITLGSFNMKAVSDLNSILTPELRAKLSTAIHLLIVYSLVILVGVVIFLVSAFVHYVDCTSSFSSLKTYEKIEVEETSSESSSSLSSVM